ncbi:MAG: galactokinase [Longimicrobiales bacterium]
MSTLSLSSAPAARERAEAAFYDRFGSVPEAMARAPGRVNLIGEHVDYNDGLVLPIALDLDVVVCARRRHDRALHVTSLEHDQIGIVKLGSSERPVGWIAYVAGLATLLEVQQGADLLVASDVPPGAGLASSAAFEVAVALSLLALERRSYPPEILAQLCRRAEQEWVGVQCGIMDQYASLCCRQGHALLLDCRSLEFQQVPIPETIRFAITDCGAKRELAASAYNDRVKECREAARQLGLTALRDAVGLAAINTLPAPLDKRARHVTSEIERTRTMAAALRAGDPSQCGALMNASHDSLRGDYEVSSAALDTLVEKARSVPGVLGARLTGAGFGGHALAMGAPFALRRLRREWTAMRAISAEGGAESF